MGYMNIENEFPKIDFQKILFYKAIATIGKNVAEEYLLYRSRIEVQPQQGLHKPEEVQT